MYDVPLPFELSLRQYADTTQPLHSDVWSTYQSEFSGSLAPLERDEAPTVPSTIDYIHYRLAKTTVN